MSQKGSGAGAASGRLPDAGRNNWVDSHAPAGLRPYLKLARLDRPIGSWLLLLPCWWAAGLAAIAAGQAHPNLVHMLLFAIGAVAMRGAGCTFNDIVDRDLDRHVARTRHRPLPAGEVSVRQAVVWLGILCFTGLGVLLQFNLATIVIGAASLLVVAIYPFMKRVTGMPQAVLGLAFSWGALVGWSAVFGGLAAAPLLLYGAAVFWTIGYDTIYALQDIEDDAVVGIRSSARTFGQHTLLAIATCYGLAAMLALAAIWLAGGGVAAYAGLVLFAGHLARQLGGIAGATPQKALALFKSNRDAGLLLAAGLCLDPVLRGLI
ncbi:MAG: 4-hydroxybenzoate octaprenyltransferase [Beijerinckiaceae bacterium]|nr:4-hydroxybenzoate octaprenyltransferase [Beijerinckiaceae bacterium]